MLPVACSSGSLLLRDEYKVGRWDSRRARKRRICGAHVLGDVSVSCNPVLVWVHVLKLRKVADEIAEHVVEKRVRQGIPIQRSTVRCCLVCHALLVMKYAT